MAPEARAATDADLTSLLRLYMALSEEMEALKEIWPLVDGLPEPITESLSELIESEGWQTLVGLFEGQVVGFLAGRDEAMLPQAGGTVIGSIRYIFTEPEARRVGVGEAMIEAYIADASGRGIDRFDAHVSPGHRDAKNFFESHGFKARSIIMAQHEG